jgi:hypothetical protein
MTREFCSLSQCDVKVWIILVVFHRPAPIRPASRIEGRSPLAHPRMLPFGGSVDYFLLADHPEGVPISQYKGVSWYES